MWGWCGHVARRGNTDLIKNLADRAPLNKNKKLGRPFSNWMWNQPIIQHLATTGERWENAAADHVKWREKGSKWAKHERAQRLVKKHVKINCVQVVGGRGAPL